MSFNGGQNIVNDSKPTGTGATFTPSPPIITSDTKQIKSEFNLDEILHQTTINNNNLKVEDNNFDVDAVEQSNHNNYFMNNSVNLNININNNINNFENSKSYSLLSKTSSVVSTTAASVSGNFAISSPLNIVNRREIMSSLLGNNVVPPGILPPFDHYRLQLYNYAMNVERLRCSQYGPGGGGSLPMCPPIYSTGGGGVNNPYGPRFALSMSLFPNRIFQPEEPKPQHSYIGLIAMAILSSPDSKLVLSDIYQHILDNYPYFRSRGPGWRNSIRHNLSLNDCFIKAGRSANGKGHYWAIHPANIDDFRKGDFRRRKAQRKVRKHMGLSVDDEGTDSPSPPPLVVTPPPHHSVTGLHVGATYCTQSWAAAAAVVSAAGVETTTASVMANMYSQTRKRQFDVASLLAPDEDSSHYQQQTQSHQQTQQQNLHTNACDSNYFRGPLAKRIALVAASSDIDEDIDVVASDVEDDNQNSLTDSHNNQCEDVEDFAENVSSSPTIVCPQYHHKQLSEHNQLSVSNRYRYSNLSNNHQQHHHQNVDHHDNNTNSPVSQHDGGDRQQQDTPPLTPASNTPSTTPNNSTTANWHGLMQQWPNAMDPRILGRYYSQYMAAAAVQQAAVARRVVGAQFQTTNNTNANISSQDYNNHLLQQQQTSKHSPRDC